MKPLKSEVVFSSPWFDLLAKTVDPAQAPYYSLRLPDYASIIALTGEGRVLLVKQFRPAVERYTLELPSGMVDPGETPAEAVSCELIEETGYRATSLEPLGAMLPDAGRLGNRIWSFFATGVSRVEGRALEPGIEVLTFSPAELAQATAGGQFDHALHIAALMVAVLQGKLLLP